MELALATAVIMDARNKFGHDRLGRAKSHWNIVLAARPAF
jgi:hypothetical protein